MEMNMLEIGALALTLLFFGVIRYLEKEKCGFWDPHIASYGIWNDNWTCI